MIDTLVFSGGGINAFYFIGALETLINKKKINQIFFIEKSWIQS